MTDNRTYEPTKEMILAGLNAYSSKGLELDGYETTEEYPSLEMWGDRFASQMRAALVAAQGATTEELAKIKPLFENLSREYPNECNKRVKAEAERDAALAAIERGRNVLELLRNYAEDSIGTTHGMLSASFVKAHVEIALSELDEATALRSGRWEYRGRLQSCGYVAEGYISAEYAMNGLRVELEDHPYLTMDDTAIVERARVREWLPVEGEKP